MGLNVTRNEGLPADPLHKPDITSPEWHGGYAPAGYDPMARDVLMVDYDGTLMEWGGLMDDTLRPMPGAPEAIKALREAGYVVRVYSSRLSEKWLVLRDQDVKDHLDYMERRLSANGIEHDGFALSKEPALAYIDDRGVEFNNNWPEIRDRFLAAKGAEIAASIDITRISDKVLLKEKHKHDYGEFVNDVATCGCGNRMIQLLAEEWLGTEADNMDLLGGDV